MTVRILTGDVREKLAELPDASVHCCITSPPYFGLRSYLPDGHAAKHLEIGLEDSPAAYVAALVDVFRGVRRVLRDDGTCWVVIGDSYAGSGKGGDPSGLGKQSTNAGSLVRGSKLAPAGLKPKDLIGIPWRLAFALQDDGWWLRQDIVWSKPGPMPESVTDRCTRAHEYIFLLSKSATYHYDAAAIAEPAVYPNEQLGIVRGTKRRADAMGVAPTGNEVPGADADYGTTRNKRSVWTVTTGGFDRAHFATFPPALIEPCVLAGCPRGGTVLDIFFGAGTTGLVADRLGRDCIGIDINPEYAAMAGARIKDDAPLFAEVAQ